MGEDIGLRVAVEHPVTPEKPIVILTYVGTQPELKSIILNSHMDVVPVFEEYWTHKPFDADMDEEGRIFARGSQDMKCVGMQYLGAIRFFKRKQVTFKRTIHVMFVPEEELGGDGGMADFIHTEAFRNLNAAFSLDEGKTQGAICLTDPNVSLSLFSSFFLSGIASPSDVFNIYYAERCIWHIIFKINGTPGHGSLLLKDTAGEKLRNFLDKMFAFRATQVERLNNDPDLTIGDVTTVNVTMIEGGVHLNVLPDYFTIMTDFRLAVDVNHDEFEEMFKQWCTEAGENIEYEWDLKDPFIPPTKLDESNIFWPAFKAAVNEL